LDRYGVGVRLEPHTAAHTAIEKLLVEIRQALWDMRPR
jgi:hypothetical protein